MNEDQFLAEKKSSRRVGKIAIVLAVICIMAVSGVLFATGVFSDPSTKVAAAFSNTIKDQSHLIKDLDCSTILNSGQYELQFDGSTTGIGVNFSYADSEKLKQIKSDVSIIGYPQIKAIMQVDAEKVKLNIPVLGDKIYTYDYINEKTGYITETSTEEDIKLVDNMIKMMYDTKAQKQVNEQLAKALGAFYSSLKFEAVDAKEFEVDSKKVKCNGYQTVVTGDQMKQLIEQVEKIMTAYYSEIPFDEGESISDSFAEAKEAYDGMKALKFTTYIYKDMVAAIEATSEDETALLELKGGATRGQNLCLTVDDEKVFEITGKTEDEVESLKLSNGDEEIMTINYNFKNGELSFALDEELELDLKLKIKKDDKGLQIELVDFDVDGVSLKGKLSLTKEPTFETLEGEAFDLGNATEEELEKLGEELEENASELSNLLGIY